jgi:hypothetical protein
MKTFHPFVSSDVDASSPHPPNTTYRISLGIEYWEGGPVEVSKIQMVYDGVVSGRRSPSYPAGTDDFERVTLELRRLLEHAKHLPMTFERLRAFPPESPAAKAMMKEKIAADMDRMLKPQKKATVCVED